MPYSILNVTSSLPIIAPVQSHDYPRAENSPHTHTSRYSENNAFWHTVLYSAFSKDSTVRDMNELDA